MIFNSSNDVKLKTSVNASFGKHAPQSLSIPSSRCEQRKRKKNQAGAKESRTKFRTSEAEEQTISLRFRCENGEKMNVLKLLIQGWTTSPWQMAEVYPRTC